MWVEPHNGKFRIRDRDSRGKCYTVQSGIDTKTAAKRLLATHTADQLRGDFVDPRAGRMTIAEFVAGWWGTWGAGGHVNTLKVSAHRQETGRIRNHILPRVGHIRLDEYDQPSDAWWISELQADGLGPKSIRNVHGLLYQAMEVAVAHRRIRINPCKGTWLPELETREMRFLLEPEAERLVAALPEHWRPIPITLLGTGLRWAELAGLRAGRVDILGGTLRVEETLQEVGRELVSVPPKSKWSRRTITLPDSVRDALVSLLAARRRNEYLFAGTDGQPLAHKRFYKYVWMPARAAADLADVRIHDLRHTHAAWLISDEVPLTAIQRRLGHSSIAITSDIYGHLLPHVDDRLVGALNRRMSLIPGEQKGSSGPGTDRSSPVLAGDTRS